MISVSLPLAPYQVNLFKFFTTLSYANSAINPFLYAFTNEAFKSAFADAFRCVASELSQHPTARGGERKRRADAGVERAADDEAPAVDVDHAGCQGQGSAIRLKTMATTSITGQTQVRQEQVASDRLPLATTAVNSDFDGRKACIIVHLEQQQQQ